MDSLQAVGNYMGWYRPATDAVSRAHYVARNMALLGVLGTIATTAYVLTMCLSGNGNQNAFIQFIGSRIGNTSLTSGALLGIIVSLGTIITLAILIRGCCKEKQRITSYRLGGYSFNKIQPEK